MDNGVIVVAGLGNPGREYQNTRHNMGFEVVNKLAHDHNIELNRKRFNSHFGDGRIGETRVMLVKPQAYMNLSGECVRDILYYFKLAPENLIVVYDDADIDPGEIRVRLKGSAGSHNGMKNIIYQLETDEFVRVRVGIGKSEGNIPLRDYVLGRIKDGDADLLIEGIVKAGDAVKKILSEGVTPAMNLYNRKREIFDGDKNE